MYFEFPKDKFGNQHFSFTNSQYAFFLVYWYLYKFKSGKSQDLLSIMKVIKVYQEIYSIQLVLASVTMLNVSMPVKVE